MKQILAYRMFFSKFVPSLSLKLLCRTEKTKSKISQTIDTLIILSLRNKLKMLYVLNDLPRLFTF